MVKIVIRVQLIKRIAKFWRVILEEKGDANKQKRYEDISQKLIE